MFTPEALQSLQADLGRDALAFLPELILCGTIVLLLLLRLFRAFNPLHLGWVALVLTFVALGAAWCQWHGWYGLRSPDSFYGQSQAIFTGLLVYDNFTVFLRMFLL